MDQAPVEDIDIVRSLETRFGALAYLLQSAIKNRVPHFRSLFTTKGIVDGAGLGLSTVQTIVRK